MAKCTPIASITRYSLELSVDEYAVLMAVLRRISGSRLRSPRKHTDEILLALISVSTKTQATDKSAEFRSLVEGVVHFRDA